MCCQISAGGSLVASLRVLPALWELGVIRKGPGCVQPHPSPFLQGEPSLVFAFPLTALLLGPADAPQHCTWTLALQVEAYLGALLGGPGDPT